MLNLLIKYFHQAIGHFLDFSGFLGNPFLQSLSVHVLQLLWVELWRFSQELWRGRAGSGSSLGVTAPTWGSLQGHWARQEFLMIKVIYAGQECVMGWFSTGVLQEITEMLLSAIPGVKHTHILLMFWFEISEFIPLTIHWVVVLRTCFLLEWL